MNTLKQTLTEQTTELKNQFIEDTKLFAYREFNRMKKVLGMTEEQRLDYFGIPWEYKKYHYSGDDLHISIKNYNKSYYSFRDKIDKYHKIINSAYKAFEDKEVHKAVLHYLCSVDKLVYRLEQKGLINGSPFNVTTAKIGINLEITITHDNQITKAKTIYAAGEINCPHYRYLVK